jgi:hypothetical protein
MADLTPLTESGMNLDALGPGEKEALSRLDDSEVAALVAIRAKLNGGDEVSGYQFQAPGQQAPGSEFAPSRLLDDGNFVW